jgi:succinate dehydrogenase hydrophobic anchor subunit
MLIFSINLIIVIILLCIIILYSIRNKKPYPKIILDTFNEPIYRFFTYLILYLISIYNPIFSILCILIVIPMHIDYINLYLK